MILGRTQILLKTIELLEHTRHEIAGIGTCKAASEYLAGERDFEETAKRLGVPYFCDPRINSAEVQEVLKEMNADIAISVNWLTVINEDTMKIFPCGILNGHSGDLPRYRGNACPNWAIINGEERIGVSVHYMEPSRLDSGNILVKEFIHITDKTTIAEVYDQIETLLPGMFVRAVNLIEETGNTAGVPQSKRREDVLRCYPRVPGDSYIEWDKTCTEIDRLIRASGPPFQGAYTYVNGREKMYIDKAERREYEFPSMVICGQVVFRDCQTGETGIAARDGVIVIQEARDEMHRPCAVTQLVRSTRDRLGMSVPDCVHELQNEIEGLKKRLKELEDR